MLDFSNQEAVGEIIGLFAADGNCCHCKQSYKVRFFLSTKEEIYGVKIIKLLNNFCNRKPYLYKINNMLVIGYTSKRLYFFIQEYLTWTGIKTNTVRLTNLDHNKAFLKGFIRGYFDGDGFSDKDRRRISIVGVSYEMMYQIYSILIGFGFEPQFYFKEEKQSYRKTLYRIILKQDQALNLLIQGIQIELESGASRI